MAATTSLKLLFVVGVWRSGTSLLYSMLNLHPQISLAFETEPFGLWPLRGEIVWPDNWPTRLDFFNQCITRHRLDASKLPRQKPARECLLAMFNQLADRKPGTTIIGGKSPVYHKFLPKIAGVFPEAEFIVIWRDPLECCRSAARAGKKNAFFSQAGMMTRVLFGSEKLARGVEQLRRMGRRVHEVVYPELTSHPERELRAVCGFLGLPFDARMLDLKLADYSMVPPGEHHDIVRNGALRRNMEQREILPPELVAKGHRYAALWRRSFAPLRIAAILPPGDIALEPDTAERISDWLAVQFWKIASNLKRQVLRRIPLPLWAWLRQKRPASGPTPDPTASLPSSRNRKLTFSIITPSFRNSNWLKLCIASVADQECVEVEHIVQDACSDDGTLDWLPQDRRVKAFIEKDDGMYDAVNRGLRRAHGDILAYLNCDEQYLPGALRAVREYFEAHPEVDVALAGAIVADGHGQYLCHRHALVPGKHQIWFRFPALTCAIFFRRTVVDPMGVFFDPRWRALGDLHWIRELQRRGVRLAVCEHFTSVFTDDGKNLCLTPKAVAEQKESLAMAPAWVRALKPVWIGQHRLRRLAAGHFNLKPTSYDIYTLASPGERRTIEVPHPTAIWRNRL